MSLLPQALSDSAAEAYERAKAAFQACKEQVKTAVAAAAAAAELNQQQLSQDTTAQYNVYTQVSFLFLCMFTHIYMFT